jgi:phosphoglycolate phosphatase
LDKRAKIGEILEKHGLARDETAFVGDMIHDVETARHGGVMSIAVLTGYDSIEKLTPSKPDVVVTSLDALRRLLQDPREALRSTGDCIRINGLQVPIRIGVGDDERAHPQNLIFDVLLETDFAGVGDDITRTTDYAAVAGWITSECARREVRLLETLSGDLAEGLLEKFPRVKAVTLEIRKFILPETESVSVRVRRAR